MLLGSYPFPKCMDWWLGWNISIHNALLFPCYHIWIPYIDSLVLEDCTGFCLFGTPFNDPAIIGKSEDSCWNTIGKLMCCYGVLVVPDFLELSVNKYFPGVLNCIMSSIYWIFSCMHRLVGLELLWRYILPLFCTELFLGVSLYHGGGCTYVTVLPLYWKKYRDINISNK